MNYTDLREGMVIPMLQSFGIGVTYIAVDEGDLDPATGQGSATNTEYSVSALVTERANKSSEGDTTGRELEVILAEVPEPAPGDMIVYNGSYYTVRELLQSIEPGGVSVYYKVRAEA